MLEEDGHVCVCVCVCVCVRVCVRVRERERERERKRELILKFSIVMQAKSFLLKFLCNQINSITFFQKQPNYLPNYSIINLQCLKLDI